MWKRIARVFPYSTSSRCKRSSFGWKKIVASLINKTVKYEQTRNSHAANKIYLETSGLLSYSTIVNLGDHPRKHRRGNEQVVPRT
jgi:hypothetical protein